ncbi:MAG: putative membrane protein [Rickettsiales bacterium]|jgi:uncharacterized membrane protein
MTENNRRPAARQTRPNSNQRQTRTPHNILPPAHILENYEEAAPGSVDKLLDMTKKEQDHRHSWQDKFLRFHSFSYKTGLLFGFIYNAGLLFLVYNLINQGKEELALKLFAINALLIAFAIIATAIERKMTTRKPPRRHNLNQKNHPSKDRRPQERTNSK